MGAADFQTRAKGKTAREAFDNATSQARYEHGHGGYTGTIAEKHSFKMLTLPEGVDRAEFVQDWIEDCDKWGDAGCLDLGNGEFLFFGMASC